VCYTGHSSIPPGTRSLPGGLSGLPRNCCLDLVLHDRLPRRTSSAHDGGCGKNSWSNLQCLWLSVANSPSVLDFFDRQNCKNEVLRPPSTAAVPQRSTVPLTWFPRSRFPRNYSPAEVVTRSPSSGLTIPSSAIFQKAFLGRTPQPTPLLFCKYINCAS
jgi:hypothetical protein